MDESSKAKKTRRRSFTSQDGDQVTKLRLSGATLREIADRLDIDVRTLKRHFEADLMLGDPRVRAQLTADVIKAALEGDDRARRFVLERKFGWRRYKETIVVQAPGAGYREFSLGAADLATSERPDGWVGPWPPLLSGAHKWPSF